MDIERLFMNDQPQTKAYWRYTASFLRISTVGASDYGPNDHAGGNE